jgi:hypothetical protein
MESASKFKVTNNNKKYIFLSLRHLRGMTKLPALKYNVKKPKWK